MSLTGFNLRRRRLANAVKAEAVKEETQVTASPVVETTEQQKEEVTESVPKTRKVRRTQK